MTRLSMNNVRCEALFASELQSSDAPTAKAVAEAISSAILRFGIDGCTSRMAQEFGDHPELAADRMRWVRQLTGEAFASRRTAAGGPGGRSAPSVTTSSRRAA